MYIIYSAHNHPHASLLPLLLTSPLSSPHPILMSFCCVSVFTWWPTGLRQGCSHGQGCRAVYWSMSSSSVATTLQTAMSSPGWGWRLDSQTPHSLFSPPSLPMQFPSYRWLFAPERRWRSPRFLGALISHFHTNYFPPSTGCSDTACLLVFLQWELLRQRVGGPWTASSRNTQTHLESQTPLSQSFPKQTNAHTRHPLSSNARSEQVRFANMSKTVKEDAFVGSAEVDWFHWDLDRRPARRLDGGLDLHPVSSSHSSLNSYAADESYHSGLHGLRFLLTLCHGYLFINQGSRNQMPQTKWYEATESYSLTDLSANVWLEVSVGLWSSGASFPCWVTYH